jgi:hypothetical protein
MNVARRRRARDIGERAEYTPLVKPIIVSL